MHQINVIVYNTSTTMVSNQLSSKSRKNSIQVIGDSTTIFFKKIKSVVEKTENNTIYFKDQFLTKEVFELGSVEPKENPYLYSSLSTQISCENHFPSYESFKIFNECDWKFGETKPARTLTPQNYVGSTTFNRVQKMNH